MFTKIDGKENLQNFVKGFDYLSERKDCNGKFGCVGFCWGGALSNVEPASILLEQAGQYIKIASVSFEQRL